MELSGYIAAFSYPGIYIWFAVLEQLTPIPEEVSLTSLGYIARQAHLNYIACWLTSLAGLLSTDTFLFYIALKGNRITERLLDKINPKIVDKLKERLKAHPARAILVFALLPKLRFLSPIICGTGGISFRLFFILNLMATACYTTFYMVVGILFHRQLNRILHTLLTMQHLVFIGSMLLLTGLIIWKLRKPMLKAKSR